MVFQEIQNRVVLSRLPPEEDPIMNVIGLGESGHTDLPEKHDDHLCALNE